MIFLSILFGYKLVDLNGYIKKYYKKNITVKLTSHKLQVGKKVVNPHPR